MENDRQEEGRRKCLFSTSQGKCMDPVAAWSTNSRDFMKGNFMRTFKANLHYEKLLFLLSFYEHSTVIL